MRESEIEKLLVREVMASGGVAYKFTSPGNDGVPDRIVMLPGGRVVFVELKSAVGRATRLQNRQIERMRKLKADVRIVRGLVGLSEFFISLGLWQSAERIERRLERGER